MFLVKTHVAAQNCTRTDVCFLQVLYSRWVVVFLAGEVATVIGSLFFSREVCISQRKLFSQKQRHAEKLNQMQSMLFDLVPSVYVKHMVMGCTYLKATPGRVAVMQLDVCKFAVISQTLEPTRLAGVSLCFTYAHEWRAHAACARKSYSLYVPFLRYVEPISVCF